MCKRSLILGASAALVLILATINGQGQPATKSVLASGLRAPTKIILSPKGNLLVAEAGFGPNTGRISILDMSGNRRTLIDGLPSGFAPPESSPSGPSGLGMRGRTLYAVIGAGDGTLAGPLPATEVPNPSPSSPFLSAVLSMLLSPLAEETTTGFEFTKADEIALQTRGFAKLRDDLGNELLVKVVVNFRNFTFEPRPGFAGNVRASNPFGIEISGKKLYVVDAAQNQIWEIDQKTEERRILYKFDPMANPLPFGPPFIDVVPDSIRLVGKSLLVPLLTGFPFPAGAAEVRKIRLVNSANEPFITGLSSAIDVLPANGAGSQLQFFTLEFSTAMLSGAPGRLTLFDRTGGSPVVLLDDLITPTSMTRDPLTGDLFVTQIFTGQIVRVHVQ